MKTFWVHDIDWDTDGEDVDLPTDVEVNIDDNTMIQLTGEDLGDYLSDRLSEEYGFCHRGFGFMEVNRGKPVKVVE